MQGGEVSNIRTSSGMFFGRGESQVLKEVEERIAQWTMVDSGQGEGIQVLDYKVGQPVLRFSKFSKPFVGYFDLKELCF